MDLRVLEVQIWLNSHYKNFEGYKEIEEDGLTGNLTVQALIRALQIELQISPVDGIMGQNTSNAFDIYFPDGLSIETYSKNTNIVRILTGGFYCRGIDPGSFTDDLNNDVINAIKTLQEQIGIDQSGIVNAKLIGAVLTTNAFTLNKDGDSSIRLIQQDLNEKYSQYFSSYIPTNGLVARETMDGLLMGVQSEIGATVDGFWGNDTISKLPNIPSSQSTKRLVYLLQYALYINGYNPNGFDGLFGNGVIKAIEQCQSDYLLTVDGYCGKQTWGALLVSCGDTSRIANACDTRFEITSSLAQKLKSDGYNIVGRYIVGGDFKELRDGELNVILNNNLKSFLIYQRYDRNIKNFGPIEGGRAAVNANGAIIKHKIPNNAIIYFAIDMDVYEEDINSNIIPYFQGINKYKNNNYKVGIYGPRLVCQRVLDSGLAEACFLSDMSYKYSCNIGQKIPQNWNFDQFQEIKNYCNDNGKSIDIDKVIYSGKGNLIDSINTFPGNFEDVNSQLYEKLGYVYNLAQEYMTNGYPAIWNYLVVNYFRQSQYSGLEWDLLVGNDSNWINYVNTRLPNGETKGTYMDQTYIYDRNLNFSIKFDHLSVALASIMNNSNMCSTDSSIEFSELQTKIIDLCSWAGDLIQLLTTLQENNKDYTADDLINNIGNESGVFGLEDLIQDIDAINIFRDLKNKPIREAFYDYYELDNNLRFKKFIENRTFIGSLPESVNSSSSPIDICHALAYQYINKTDSDTSLLVNLFTFLKYGILDSNRWKDMAPNAWGQVINNYIEKGM